jgi:hypothetical protein
MNIPSLLSLEVRRFLPNGTFRALVVLYVVFFIGGYGLAQLIGDNFQMTANGETLRPLEDLFVHPKNWQLLAWIGSWPNVTLLGFLGVFMITLEFQLKTLRQSIIFGLTRPEAAAAKGLFAIALAAAATLVFLALGTAGGLATGSLSVPPPLSVLGFFLQALGYLSLGTLAGLLIRQTALAIIAYLAYVIFLETVARWIFTLVVAPHRALLFLPDKVLEELAPLPLPEAVSQAIKSATATLPAALNPLESIAAALVYLSLFAFLFFRHLRHADL